MAAESRIEKKRGRDQDAGNPFFVKSRFPAPSPKNL